MEDYATWCQEHELTEATVDALKDNGISSLKSASLLTAALIQKHLKSLPLGQALLLQQGIESLTKPKDVDMSTAPLVNAAKTDAGAAPQEASLDTSTLLQLLQKDPSDNQAAATGKHPHTHTFDPFNCNVASPGKLYDLRDFITVMPEFREKSTALKVGDNELTLPTQRSKLESITPLQYMEGSLRVMREMAKEGRSLTELLQYAGYLIKIANMGQRFQWRSVLQYDTEYRKAQADAGFDFGADSSYLMQVFLRDGLTPKPHSAAKDSVHPKQSMTLLVAGQFVGNSIPPRVVPCATANSPMFAALASSPIVTTPINPFIPTISTPRSLLLWLCVPFAGATYGPDIML